MTRAVLGFALALWAAALGASEVVSIPTREGVTLSYLLVHDPSAAPTVVVISFIGGNGVIDLLARSSKGPLQFGPTANVLIRIRDQVADSEFADVLVDAPSDQLPKGMSDTFRMGPQHLADIRALIADLNARFPGAKIFLVGTSRGTISTAALATKLQESVQGIVLSSTVTQRDRMGDALSTFDFSAIKVPVLIVHHRDDGCRASPYFGAEHLGKRYPIISVSGGDAPLTGPCDAGSAHGYLGREAQMTQAIKNWMLGRDFPRDIS